MGKSDTSSSFTEVFPIDFLQWLKVAPSTEIEERIMSYQSPSSIIFCPSSKGLFPMAFSAHYPRLANGKHLILDGQIDWKRYLVQSSRVFFHTSHLRQNFQLHFSSMGGIFKLACDFLLNIKEEIDNNILLEMLFLAHSVS